MRQLAAMEQFLKRAIRPSRCVSGTDICSIASRLESEDLTVPNSGRFARSEIVLVEIPPRLA